MKSYARFLLAGGLLAGVVGAPYAADSTSTTTATSTATTVVPLHFERKCPMSGTSVMDGSYDTVTGKVAITSTVSACTMWNGEVQEGSTTINGTLTPTTAKVVNIDMTTVDTLSVTRNGVKVTNSCTYTKQGAFDQATHIFTGKSGTNCTVDGTVRDHGGLVEYLLRRSEVLGSSTSSGTTSTTQ